MRALLTTLALVALTMWRAPEAHAQRARYLEGDVTSVQNNMTIDTNTTGQIKLERPTAGAVTITCADDDANCAMVYDAGGTGAITVGSADVTGITFTTDGTGVGEITLPADSVDLDDVADTLALDADLTLTQGAAEQVIHNKTATDATADNGVELNYTALDTTSGTTTQHALLLNNAASTEGADALLALDNSDADDNVAAGILFLNPARYTAHITGAGAMVFGTATTTSWTFTTDGTGTGEIVLPLQSVEGAELVNDTVDGAQLKDTVDLDTSLIWTVGAAEVNTWNKTATDAVAENGLVLNYTASDVAAATTAQYGLLLNNAASTEGADSLLVLDNADVDDNVISGIRVVNPARFTSHFDATGALVFGSATVTAFTFTTDGTGDGTDVVLPAQAVGAAEILNDTVDGAQLADTIAMDAAFAVTGAFGITMGGGTTTSFTVTTDGTGTGEVVLPLQSIAAGEIVNDTIDGTELVDTLTLDAAFTVTGAFAHNYGNSLATSITIATDGTGDAELVLPLLSVSNGEITADTIDGTALIDTLTLDAAFVVTGAQSINFGNNLATTVTIDTDGTGDAEFVVPDESISAAEITNPTRPIDLPIGSWLNCVTLLPLDVVAADAQPDFVAVNTALVIEYDDAATPDTSEICNGFTVPDDYVSGGSFQFRLTQDAATATIEDWDCRISVDGAAIGVATSVVLVSQAAAQTISMTPAGTWAAGASIGVACKQSDVAPDDAVRLHGAHAEYTAAQ